MKQFIVWNKVNVSCETLKNKNFILMLSHWLENTSMIKYKSNYISNEYKYRIQLSAYIIL